MCYSRQWSENVQMHLCTFTMAHRELMHLCLILDTYTSATVSNIIISLLTVDSMHFSVHYGIKKLHMVHKWVYGRTDEMCCDWLIEWWTHICRRYPWARLPDHMCFRDRCDTDGDCCRRFNICDRSAHVCVDCWYGSPCTNESQCCLKYPTCRLPDLRGGVADANRWGQCVDD